MVYVHLDDSKELLYLDWRECIGSCLSDTESKLSTVSYNKKKCYSIEEFFFYLNRQASCSSSFMTR